jgi:hypothetical protein
MKLLEKKSVVELPPAVGSIADTTNIKDKEKNTYSARVIEEMLAEGEGTLIAITNKEIDEIIV